MDIEGTLIDSGGADDDDATVNSICSSSPHKSDSCMKRNYVICRRRNLENLKRFAEFLEFVQEHFITQSRERLYTLYIIHDT